MTKGISNCLSSAETGGDLMQMVGEQIERSTVSLLKSA